MQGEHWTMVAKSRQLLYFADSLGRKKYSFLKQLYEQIMPEPLQSHPRVCDFYTIYAAFHLFKIRQEKLQEFTMLMYFIHKYIHVVFQYL